MPAAARGGFLPDFRHYLYPFGGNIGRMCAQNIAPSHNDAMRRYFGPPKASGKRKFILTIFSAICGSLVPTCHSHGPGMQQVTLTDYACPFTGTIKVLSKSP
jgi:hypothetical protein